MTNPEENRELIFEGVGISKTYARGSKFTLAPVDIQLYAGEITAVVGENGDGKTTLLSMISGKLFLTQGEVYYPYLEKHGLGSFYDRQQGVAILTQELPSWNGKLVDNLHFFAALRGIKGKENEEWVMYILERLGLMKYKDSTWKQISGGYRTRFSLARALAQKPNLLVLDEPLANLDINAQLVFVDDLKDLVKSMDQPIAMVISSQHLHEIEKISDEIIFIRDGETLYNGPMAEFAADREENVFELTCDVPKEEVEKVLKEVGLSGSKTAGENLILQFPREVESDKVLKALMDGGIKVQLFRDISQSTRKLFRVED